MNIEGTPTTHVINDDDTTFDRKGYATRTLCGIRFRAKPNALAVWPDERKRGYVVVMGKRLRFPKDERWCRRCAR